MKNLHIFSSPLTVKYGFGNMEGKESTLVERNDGMVSIHFTARDHDRKRVNIWLIATLISKAIKLERRESRGCGTQFVASITANRNDPKKPLIKIDDLMKMFADFDTLSSNQQGRVHMQICSSAVHCGSGFAVVNWLHILGVNTNFFWFVEKFVLNGNLKLQQLLLLGRWQ